MKIHIWIRKQEAISGNITKYYVTEPVSNLKDPDKYETDYVQVQLTKDEFARLEDTKHTESWVGSDEWHVEQYNRNRDQKDWIKSKDEIPYIYERNGEEVYRRREGDTERELLTTPEFHASKKPIKRNLKKLVTELQTIPGSKFADWWKGLTKEEQIQLTEFWE